MIDYFREVEENIIHTDRSRNKKLCLQNENKTFYIGPNLGPTTPPHLTVPALPPRYSYYSIQVQRFLLSIYQFQHFQCPWLGKSLAFFPHFIFLCWLTRTICDWRSSYSREQNYFQNQEKHPKHSQLIWLGDKRDSTLYSSAKDVKVLLWVGGNLLTG